MSCTVKYRTIKYRPVKSTIQYTINSLYCFSSTMSSTRVTLNLKYRLVYSSDNIMTAQDPLGHAWQLSAVIGNVTWHYGVV